MNPQPPGAVDGLMHILIADDDPVSRVYLRAAVERLGHRCTVAYDGAVAWELFQEERPDLLITDWQMPGLTGTEATGGSPRAHSFHGNVTVNAATAKMRLVQIAEEIIAVLVADPNAEVKVSVEIQATFPNGAKDQTKRAVSENAKTLGFNNAEWD